MITVIYRGDSRSIELDAGVVAYRDGEPVEISEERYAELIKDPTIKLEPQQGSKRAAAHIEKAQEEENDHALS